MPRKLPTTPKSRVRSALRQVWLRSRERAARLKQSKNTCESCGRKASQAKGKELAVYVHHVDGIGNWDEVLNAVYEQILVTPEKLRCLCKECHEKEHTHE